MYFWLCWAFTVALGLSLVAVSEGCSLVAELGCRAWLSSVAPGLSCPMAHVDSSRTKGRTKAPYIGRQIPTEPPGKSCEEKDFIVTLRL